MVNTRRGAMSSFGGPSFGDPDYDTSPTKKAALFIGNYAVELPHLRFGDTKVVKPRQVLRRDLIVCQHTWPKRKTLEATFANLWRPVEGEAPTEIETFWKLIRQFPGWTARIKMPSGIEYEGIVTVANGAEDDRCKESISFTFEVSTEFYPEGMMVTEYRNR
jgi:hypothetical protein